ncbi:MAG: NAD-dependent protein deacylase [Planctomycetes bacterium]|nr:NAD-dependent protein deacylase [Planctomycetota bacterium]
MHERSSDDVREEHVRAVAGRLRAARAVTVLTGAGVSAASGVPTFRGRDGLWRRRRVEELATPAAFARDPRTVWEWYAERRAAVARCVPNAAHEVLSRWSRELPGFLLVTQNVDGLHERAGTADVVRFHGSLWEVGCWAGCAGVPRRWRDERVAFDDLPPRCPSCGAPLRPGVVWFGEAIPTEALERLEQALACELFLVVGTSAVVYPAAGLLDAAAARGAFTVEVNPFATDASGRVDLALRGPAEDVLARVDAVLRGAPG